LDVPPRAIKPGTTNYNEQKKEGHPMAMSVKKTKLDVNGKVIKSVLTFTNDPGV
jgi:hypothetical protein